MSKLATTDPLEIMQRAKVIATKATLNRMIGDALEIFAKIDTESLSADEADKLFDGLLEGVANAIVNDLSPRETLLGVK